MEVWVDPETKRIKAVYQGCSTNSTVWVERGYEKHDNIEPWMLPLEPPQPDAPKYPEEIMIKGADGKNYGLTVDGAGKLALKLKAL